MADPERDQPSPEELEIKRIEAELAPFIHNEVANAAVEAFRDLFDPEVIADAALKRRKVMRVVDDAFTARHRTQSAEELVGRFQNWDNNHAARTKADYAKCVLEFADWLGDDVPLADVDRRDVILYMDYLKHRRPRKLSQSRRKAHLAALRSFYRWLMYEDPDRKHDPTYGVVRPKVKVDMKPVLRPEELKAILEEPRGGARDRIQAWLLAYTAARTAELRNLKWSDIDPDEKIIHLVGKGDKERVVDINPNLWPEITKWHAAQKRAAKDNPGLAKALDNPETAFVLLTSGGKKLKEGALWKALKRRAARAGVRPLETERDKRGRLSDNASEVTPHMLRRTFATTLRRRGTSLDVVASILGHSSLDTTRRHYASHSDEQRKQAIHDFKLA